MILATPPLRKKLKGSCEPAFWVKLSANDLNSGDVPLNPSTYSLTHSLTHSLIIIIIIIIITVITTNIFVVLVVIVIVNIVVMSSASSSASSIGVGAQSTLKGQDIFARKYMHEKLTKCPNFT